ncbi:quinon protein alcohol dehydrogenase-like superfamily [Ustulina deusta]|nr:quinon protein alcohol dehydrogenase-like superfamily [Ustulina deusta]
MRSIEKSWKSWKSKRSKDRGGESGEVVPPDSLNVPRPGDATPLQSNLLELDIPPSSTITTAQVAPASDEPPPTLATTSASRATSNDSSHHNAGLDLGPEEGQPAMSDIDQPATPGSISQRLWNAAYDSLEKDKDTAELVSSYVKVLTKALLKAEGTSSDASASEDNVSVELKDPIARQKYMRKLVEEGREKFATTSKIMEGLGNAVGYIQSVKGLIEAAIANIPQAALPWAGVCIGLQILSNPGRATKSNRQGLVHVISRMDWYCALSEHLLDKNELVESFESVLLQLEDAIIRLYKALLLYQFKSACYYHQNRGATVLRGLANLDDWDGDLQEVKDAEAAVELMSAQYHREHGKSLLSGLLCSGIRMEKSLGDIHQDFQDIITQQTRIWKDTKHRQCLQDLFVVDPRDNMRTIMGKKEELLLASCEWIFRTDEYAAFANWSNEISSLPVARLLWIKGVAGTGKTMLLIGIIHELQRQLSSLAPRLSYFFCQGTNKTLNNAKAILRSLIWLLLFQQPHLIEHIQPEYDHKGRALFENEDAFYALNTIFESMLKDSRLSPVYLVVDALDECDQGLALLLRTISRSLTLSDKVKWLVSSRYEVGTQPDVNLKQELRNIDSPDIPRAIVHLDSERLGDPVNLYITRKLSDLKDLMGYSDKVLGEISAEVRQRATNIFLWVALVFKELSTVDEWDAVATIKDMPPSLSELYDRMMNRIDKLKNPNHCKNALAAVSLAFRPLSLAELAVVAGLPAGENVSRKVVEGCGSFLTITGETVSLIHQSAKDYLDKNYETSLQPDGATQGHMSICERSIVAMSANLRENIYGLDLGSDPSSKKPPNPDPLAPIRYACLFWVDHLSFGPGPQDFDRVYSFLELHFLHWLEALSLMGYTVYCSRMINKLEALSSTHSEQLHSLIYDAKRFILRNAFIIESAPIQLYTSAILFSPQESRIRKIFQQNIDGISVLSGVESNWGPALQTIEGYFWNLLFSPDGTRLVLLTNRGNMLVWDVATSQAEHRLESSSPGETNAAILSPDGSKLAVGSNSTIEIWDMETGQSQHILEGHCADIQVVAFSPDGNHLASGSSDKNVRLWNVESGETERILSGHSRAVQTVLFSPDGRKLVSVSGDQTMLVWDVPSGQHEHTLELEEIERPLFSSNKDRIAFSSDGARLVSVAGKDMSICVWDTKTWQPKHVARRHSNLPSCFAFSPDGNKVVFRSSDGTIHVWDVATGQAKQILGICSPISGHMTSLVFSPDGKWLASSFGNTVQLWDAETWKVENKLESHTFLVKQIAFSPDGERLASALLGGTARIWDISSSLVECTPGGHSKMVNSLVLSADGTKLASGSADTTARIWDITTGRTELILNHSESVIAVVLSPDGSALAASLMLGAEIHIWDLVTGQRKHILKSDPASTRTMSFSPDGTKLVSGCWNGRIRVWDVATGRATCLQASDYVASGHIERILDSSEIANILLFSPDGRKLASGSRDRTIRVWDVTTGQAEQTFRGHAGFVTTAIFELDSESMGSMMGGVGMHPFYSVGERNHWVTLNGSKLLYLPPAVQPGQVVVKGRTLVTSGEYGRVTIMKFAEGFESKLSRLHIHEPVGRTLGTMAT